MALDERQLTRLVERLEDRVAELERAVANFPVRDPIGGGGGLPPGGRKFDVLMKLDDAGSVGWERPRFHE